MSQEMVSLHQNQHHMTPQQFVPPTESFFSTSHLQRQAELRTERCICILCLLYRMWTSVFIVHCILFHNIQCFCRSVSLQICLFTFLANNWILILKLLLRYRLAVIPSYTLGLNSQKRDFRTVPHFRWSQKSQKQISYPIPRCFMDPSPAQATLKPCQKGKHLISHRKAGTLVAHSSLFSFLEEH